MSSEECKEWKKSVGFPINYESDDGFDMSDVVIRHPRRSTNYLLADGGDGAEADLLGTTPPRARIRNKEKRRSLMVDSESGVRAQRDKRVSADDIIELDTGAERVKRRWGKMQRVREDRIQKMEDLRADSVPLQINPAAPTLVESCNRFMSLTSRLKCRNKLPEPEQSLRECGLPQYPASRVSFHQTFSMLINMGNVEKGCRRTISREEQVWQNELKDLIWLELQAKLAGRTLDQQDAYLCARRRVIPAVAQDVLNYRFVNPNPCKSSTTVVNIAEAVGKESLAEGFDPGVVSLGCLSFSCISCTSAVGSALREVGALLDSVYHAAMLYPSSIAMTTEHPLFATKEVHNRLKAMCQWYNIAMHMQMKALAVRRMLRAIQLKRSTSEVQDSVGELSRESSEIHRTPCIIRFNISNNPTDSSNSDSSVHSDYREEKQTHNGPTCGHKKSDEQASDNNDADNIPKSDISDDKEVDSSKNSSENSQQTNLNSCIQNGSDESDSSVVNDRTNEVSRESNSDSVNRRDSGRGDSCTECGSEESKDLTDVTQTSSAVPSCPLSPNETRLSTESGYSSVNEACEGSRDPDEVYALQSLEELARLRVLNKCRVSPYRNYHYDMLKTQGVRRCMTFIHKMRKNLLTKVYLTFEKLDEPAHEEDREEGAREDESDSENDKETFELMRYGCWSAECLGMALPSYRNHFLLLSSICMEAVHDYLSLRLEDRPDNPSCLTVKQLIHEIKEGLDIATDMRATYVRNVEVALQGMKPESKISEDLKQILQTYDDTVETMFKQYLSYLQTMSEVEQLSRAYLESEWAFTAHLAPRLPVVASLAPPAFVDITCNQLRRLEREFQRKYEEIGLVTADEQADVKQTVYATCRLAQSAYTKLRESALQVCGWARSLAARLPRSCPVATLHDSLLSFRGRVTSHTEVVLERSRLVDEHSQEVGDTVVARIRELLLQIYRLGFEIHKELHRFATESSRPASAARKKSLTSPAKSRARVFRTDSIDEENEPFDDYGENQAHAPIEVGAEISGEQTARDQQLVFAGRVARAIIEFAKCWMGFVVQRCDRGRGLRPRWASQGLEFLMLACDPCNTKHLTDEEFEELKQLMDGCISHVVGSRHASPSVLRPPQPRPPHSPQPGVTMSSSPGTRAPGNTTPTPPAEPESCLTFPSSPHDRNLHARRVEDAARRLDAQRDAQLQEMKAVGRVLEETVATYEPKLRQVTFKWQRGLKIGAGTFGKVYTVVNTESGQLLAMKEVGIAAGDRRALQRAANELRVLEGVTHPHLVRHYGCEVHREEMLIFMELCVEGSLEALVGRSGALSEALTRRYTRQLLAALAELHARGIAHRDVKSGNIFLTNEGHCLKLGDFGCAVKIRATSTAAGELLGTVGTQAYMAPEVFMKSSGHGRAADIWSLGCVVTEMASGKRPFSEYDSNYQIMFVVGMGGRPAIPDTLSPEGSDFCRSCLTHDPDQRLRAEQLSLHHFLMVKSDDDCKCTTSYLIP